MRKAGVTIDAPATLVSFGDLASFAPVALAAIAMPLSYSVADGLGVGFIAYAAIQLLTGRWRECPAAVYLVAVVFIAKFTLLWVASRPGHSQRRTSCLAGRLPEQQGHAVGLADGFVFGPQFWIIVAAV